MTSYSHTFEVKDYIEHARLFGRLSTILTNCLFNDELSIEREEVDFKDGSTVFKYDRKNTPDLCEFLKKQKCRGEGIKITFLTRNSHDEEKYKQIFNQIEEQAFTEYYPDEKPPEEKASFGEENKHC